MITVFYDGKCGLCSKEIRHYKKIAPAGVFDWQDISEAQERLYLANIEPTAALKDLHSIDADGNIYIGVDAFVLIWRQMNRWRYLASFMSLPIIKPLAKCAYRLFADWRFKKLSYCARPN